MNAGKLNRRVEIWGNEPTTNELGESDFAPKKIKTVWAEIVPQTGNLRKGQAETILTNVTTKFVCRYQKGITYDMWLMHDGKRHDIKYILDPYDGHISLEIFCEEVIG